MNNKKKILILDTHIDENSFSAALAEEYYAAAKKSGFDVDMLSIRDLKFDPILYNANRFPQKMEPDLEKARKLIAECNHLVIFTPVWWYGLPAYFKGFVDRVFFKGFAFVFTPETRKRKRLLEGKSVRVIYTQGATKWESIFIYRDCFWKMMKYGFLKFCGFSKIKRTYLSNVHGFRSILRRRDFTEKVAIMGKYGL